MSDVKGVQDKTGNVFSLQDATARKSIAELDANFNSRVNDYLIEKLPYVNVKDFGAVGDGVTNDTEAIQNALNSAYKVVFPQGNYCITELYLNDGNYIDGQGSIFNKLDMDYQATPCIKLHIDENSKAILTKNITLKNLTIKPMNERRGDSFRLGNVENLIMDNISCISDVPYDSENPLSNWQISLAGKNITLKNIYINSSDAGMYSDGIHLGGIDGLTITDFYINSGDDGISFWCQDNAGYGYKESVKNVRVSSGTILCKDYSPIKIGCSSTIDTTFAIQDMMFVDIICEKGCRRMVQFADERVTNESCHNIIFSNVTFDGDENSAITVEFIADSTSYPYRDIYFKNCDFFRVKSNNSNIAMNAQNVKKLVIDSCSFVDNSSDDDVNTNLMIQVLSGSEVEVKNSNIVMGNGTNAVLALVTHSGKADDETIVKLFNNYFQCVSSTWRMINLNYYNAKTSLIACNNVFKDGGTGISAVTTNGDIDKYVITNNTFIDVTTPVIDISSTITVGTNIVNNIS